MARSILPRRLWPTPYQVFYSFCALLFPLICAAAIYLAYRRHLALGLFTAGYLAAWVWHSFATTCSRCQFYGTTKCGIPGVVVPYFFKKRTLTGFPLWRIKANLYSDIALMIYLNAVFALRPMLLPLTIGATVVVWLTVYRRRRFHGLLYLLEPRRRSIPIKVLAPTGQVGQPPLAK